MSHCKIHELFYLITLVAACYGYQRPLFKVSGMSDTPTNPCRVDFNADAVDISVQIEDAECGSVDSGKISEVTGTFYKMEKDSDYKINLDNNHKIINSDTSPMTWSKLLESDVSIYAVAVSLQLTQDEFKIVGYLIVGCGSSSENYAEDPCRNVHTNFRDLAGVETNIWELKKCDGFMASYKATSRKEYTINGGTNKDDVYSEDNRLNVNLPVVFQIKSESNAFIRLHEKEIDRNSKAVEIVLEDQSQTSRIVEKNNARKKNEDTSTGDILSSEEFRFFWISFYGREVRVGKSWLPFNEQILKLDGITGNYNINYLSFGNGEGSIGTWRFDIGLCDIQSENGACPKPEDISYATMSYTGTKVGDTLTYTCNIGYIVHSGDLSQTCTDTAEWSGTKPECGVFKVYISCSSKYNCLEERNPIGNAKYEVVCDQCTFMEETSYLWTVKECKEMDATGTCSEAKVDTSSLRKLFTH
ncbi:uncharacterized protein LOC132723945 [Ruditapes philippinarum]|uniref:uncharacterized protein LOC132723945 n=1 Tax=Ruditapes philippinarum TaxID=129788 RepID=UPI00295B62EB|nr:uncharacterized protein LOC132723945 [Ruditapes philippinarum]